MLKKIKRKEYSRAELDAFTAMRRYHTCLANQVNRIGRANVVQKLPFYNEECFPDKVGTNEKLATWAENSVAMACGDRLCQYLFNGNTRMFSCGSAGAANYATVCAVFVAIMNMHLFKVEEGGDAQLGMNVMMFETADLYCRIKYNSNIEDGFLNIEVIYKNKLRNNLGIYDLIK